MSIAIVVVVQRRPVCTALSPRSSRIPGVSGMIDDSATPLATAIAKSSRSSRSKRFISYRIVTTDRLVKCDLMVDSIRNHGRLGSIEIRHLAALEAVAESGSFHRAAAELGYSQSAISQQIATLERAAGLQLLERPGGR